MAGPAVDVKVFEEIFAAPSIEKMLALEWWDFEQFVKYVFECAGFHVENVASQHNRHYVDLLLRHGSSTGRVVAAIEVRRYSSANIIAGAVLKFAGALQIEGSVPGYMITTSDFTGPAHDAARATNGRVKLLNGHRFLRYIRYVFGTRLTKEDLETSTLRQPLISPNILLDAESIPRKSVNETTLLAIGNNKGGVAKTTTALNLAFALAEKQKQRVLLIDLDGQASLTEALANEQPLAATMLDYFTHQRKIASLIQRVPRFDRIWLLPADERLFRLDLTGEQRQSLELAFVRALHDQDLCAPDGNQFDWIIFDTPASQSFFTRIAFAASHYILLPATAETQAVNGANRALGTAKTMCALAGVGSEVIGGVVTRWKKSVPAEQSLVGLIDILNRNGVRLLKSRIPEDSKVERAHQQTFKGGIKNLFHITRQQGPAAEAYEALMKEVLFHAGRN